MRHRTNLALVVIWGFGLALSIGVVAWAQQLGPSIPAGCVAHTTFDVRPDVPGDYRCAGLALDFHTLGTRRSSEPLWAGQWLFTDENGHFRMGWCTFNRGTHPTIAIRSHIVAETFPNDPTGAKGAYLAWKYGHTTDPLTSAAVWADFHYYAQDSAGVSRADDPTRPLVAQLGRLAAMSGRADLQTLAVRLDRDAVAMSATWKLVVTVTPDGVVSATLRSGSTPVPDRPISVLVSGSDDPLSATTGPDGTATVTVPLPSGTVTVAATAEAPGPAVVYRGVAADPGPNGAQTLVTAGTPRTLQATATIDVTPPTEPSTTESATTQTTEPDTTVPATVPTTVPAGPSGPPLPRTGGRGGVAYLATSFLVGGVGLVGSIRRRGRSVYTRPGDPG